MREITTLVAAIALLLTPAATVAAQDGGPETTVEETRATVEMTRSVAGQEATTSVVFDTAEGQLAAATDVPGLETHRLNLTVHQIVEYKDGDGEGAFDAEDEVVSAYRFSNASANATAPSNATVQWTPLEERTVETEDGTEGTLVVGEAQFPPADPVEGVLDSVVGPENRTLTVQMAVFDERVTYEDRELAPMQVALSIDVENYPYRANGTQLALVAEPDGAPSVTTQLHGDTRVAAEGEYDVADLSVGYDWADTATVDEEETAVNATTIPADEAEDVSTSLSLSYERGDAIRHHGLLGADLNAVDEGEITDAARDAVDEVPGPGALAVMALVGLTALAHRARR